MLGTRDTTLNRTIKVVALKELTVRGGMWTSDLARAAPWDESYDGAGAVGACRREPWQPCRPGRVIAGLEAGHQEPPASEEFSDRAWNGGPISWFPASCIQLPLGFGCVSFKLQHSDNSSLTWVQRIKSNSSLLCCMSGNPPVAHYSLQDQIQTPSIQAFLHLSCVYPPSTLSILPSSHCVLTTLKYLKVHEWAFILLQISLLLLGFIPCTCPIPSLQCSAYTLNSSQDSAQVPPPLKEPSPSNVPLQAVWPGVPSPRLTLQFSQGSYHTQCFNHLSTCLPPPVDHKAGEVACSFMFTTGAWHSSLLTQSVE